MYNYGIFFNEILGGVVCFGTVASITAGDMFGIENRDKAICLERGACAWWCHEHSASKLISYAVNDMAKTTKYRIFYAYSDDSAGEIGTVYQACNWLYLGRSVSGGSQNKLVTPDGKLRDSRGIMSYANKYTKEEIPNRTIARQILLDNGWSNRKTKPKCKYCIVKGTKKEVKDIMKQLNKKIYSYPKRNNLIKEKMPIVCFGECNSQNAIELLDFAINENDSNVIYCESNSIFEQCRDVIINADFKVLSKDILNKKYISIIGENFKEPEMFKSNCLSAIKINNNSEIAIYNNNKC